MTPTDVSAYVSKYIYYHHTCQHHDDVIAGVNILSQEVYDVITRVSKPDDVIARVSILS